VIGRHLRVADDAGGAFLDLVALLPRHMERFGEGSIAILAQLPHEVARKAGCFMYSMT